MRVAAQALGKIVSIGFTQRIYARVAILRSRLPVFVAGPSVKARLLCHGYLLFWVVLGAAAAAPGGYG
ncbi:MAG TPA: hypothetical protein VKB47_16540 [Terracidiphilus sp.]|nr:hypothetical protein [Terracidiphilus sp.]